MKKPWIHGSAVDKTTREMRFLSVSAMQKADMSSPTGCLRSWWYSYVEGKKEPQTEAQARGERFHEEIATYLQTGVKVLSPAVMAAVSIMPEPGPDLRLELDLVPMMPDGSSGIARAPLRAAGIPIVGAIDCIHGRGTNKGATDVSDIYDPPGTIEVIDWKSCKSLDHALQGHELPGTLQMAGYAKWVFEVLPETPLVRLSHGYIPSRGNPSKRTTLVDRAQIDRSWEHADRVASSIRDAAREISADAVPANTRACHAYGRDCIHRPYCKAGMHNSLADVFGQTGAESLLATTRGDTSSMTIINNAGPPGLAPSPILSQLGTATPGDAFPFGASAPVAPAAVDPAALARLAEEEARARNPQLHAIFKVFEQVGMGYPQLSGEAAASYAQMRNIPITPGAGIAGAGEFGKYNISSLVELAAAAAEAPNIAARARGEVPAPVAPVATVAPAAVGLLPPDAPVSNPILAAKPPEPVNPLEAVVAPAEGAKRGRGRPKKDKPAPAVVDGALVALVAPVAPPAAVAAPDPYLAGIMDRAAPVAPELNTAEVAPPTAIAAPTITVYVDCVTTVPTVPLWPLIHQLCQRLAQKASVKDLRDVPNDNPLAYGRWKGALAAFLREVPIAPGHYSLDGVHGEIGQVALETLREICDTRGGNLVRGAR